MTLLAALLFAVILYLGGWIGVLVIAIGIAALVFVLLAFVGVCMGLVALGRAQRRGPVKGQVFTVTVTFVGYPVTVVLNGLISPNLPEAAQTAMNIVGVGLLAFTVFFAIWSVWGPRRVTSIATG